MPGHHQAAQPVVSRRPGSVRFHHSRRWPRGADSGCEFTAVRCGGGTGAGSGVISLGWPQAWMPGWPQARQRVFSTRFLNDKRRGVMIRRSLLGLFLCLCASPMFAQELSDIQIHGFATQGFLYSSSNNYLSTNSSSGSFAWTDGVVSFTDPVSDKLRVGVQMHMSQLGEFGGPDLKVDWASGDYRVNDKVGFAVGKVKTVLGLFNDTQDVDAVQEWALLPQGVYPIENKSWNLAHYGADFYGEMPLGKQGGALAYRAYVGYRTLDLD